MKNAALLVIDIQRGAFDGERWAPIDRPEGLVASALDLVDAARASSTPVVFIQHCSGAGDLFEEGSPHWELHESLVPQTGDKVLKKYASSAFEGTDLATVLEEVHAKALVLCGLQSEFCVSNTANSALAMGFAVSIAQDGHRTWPSETEPAIAISERVNQELQARGAALAPTAALARALREAQA